MPVATCFKFMNFRNSFGRLAGCGLLRRTSSKEQFVGIAKLIFSSVSNWKFCSFACPWKHELLDLTTIPGWIFKRTTYKRYKRQSCSVSLYCCFTILAIRTKYGSGPFKCAYTTLNEVWGCGGWITAGELYVWIIF